MGICQGGGWAWVRWCKIIMWCLALAYAVANTSFDFAKRRFVWSFFVCRLMFVRSLLGLLITVGGMKSLGIAGYYPVQLHRT